MAEASKRGGAEVMAAKEVEVVVVMEVYHRICVLVANVRVGLAQVI